MRGLMSIMTRNGRRLFFLAFFVTGMAGLMAESIWQQYLAIIGGGETQAAAIVLAVIMGGSALGAHIAGSRSSIRPCRDFGLVEIALGAWCLLFPLVHLLGSQIFSFMTTSFGGEGVGLLLSRVVVAVMMLFPAAMLSGATFPLISAGVASGIGGKARVSVPARLYACNACGGATGAMIAGFLLIPAHGLHGSIMLAGILDVLAGVLVFWLGQKTVLASPETRVGRLENEGSASVVQSARTNLEKGRRRFPSLLMLALTGAVIFALEIVYFRLLSPILDSSAQSFTLMLAVFVGGLAAGGAISARLVQRIEKTSVFIWQQLLLALAIVVSLLVADRIPWILLQLRDGIAADESGYIVWMLFRIFVSALVMLPVAVIAGISFPLLLSLVTNNEVSVRNVSLGWKWNVGGTIFGALAASLFLVPVAGTRTSLVALGVLSFGIAVYAVIQAGIGQGTFKKRAGMVLVTLIFIAVVVSVMNRSNHENQFGLAWTLEKNPFEKKQDYLRALSEHRMLFFQEDEELSVSVTSHKDLRKLSGFMSKERNPGQYETRTLRVNGKPDASDNINDMSTQLLLAHVPLLLHEAPRQVAVIGLGSGTTTGAVLAHQEVAAVDTIELSRAVVSASRSFESVNRAYFKDHRSKVFVRDAGVHFASGGKAYDVIISEPSHPWMAGVSRLFSKEFFTLCRESLAENGIMTQWVHVAGLSDRTLTRIFATFENVFTGASIWVCNNGDLLMVGWKGKKQLPGDIAERMKRAEIGRQMEILGIEGVGDFLLRELTSIRSVLKRGVQQPYSSLQPELADIAPREMFTRKQAGFHVTNDLRLSGSGVLLADSRVDVREKNESVIVPFLKYVMVHERNFVLVEKIVEALPYRLKDSAVRAALAVYQADENKNLDKALGLWKTILDTDSAAVWKLEYADFLLARTDQRVEVQRVRLKNALNQLENVQQNGENAARAAWICGQGLAKLGEYGLAERYALKALSCMQPQERKGINAGHVYTLLAGIKMAQAQMSGDPHEKESCLDMARSMLEQAVMLDPEKLTGARELARKHKVLLRQLRE